MSIKIGFGIADITPDKKAALVGQFETRITEEIGSRLTATAMAVKTGEKVTIWASCDLLAVFDSTVKRAAEKISEKIADFSIDDLAVSATHIHTAPYVERDGESTLISFCFDEKTQSEIISPEEYMEIVTDGIAKAAFEAIGNMRDSYVETAVSRIKTGYNRRVTYTDGTSAMYGSVRRPDFLCLEDHNGGPVNLMYVRSAEDNSLFGVVANVPCTAQVVENKEYITCDYWGYTREYLKDKLDGVTVLPLIGSAGDLSPRDLICSVDGEPDMRDEDGCRYLGEKIAEEIIRFKDNTLARYDTDAVHEVVYADLPMWNPTKEIYDEAKAYIQKLREKYGEDFDKVFREFSMPFDEVLKFSESEVVIRRYENLTEYIKTPIHALKFGNAVLLSNPFELFIQYADRIKAANMDVHIFDVQLTNGCYGYLATRRALRGGGYSALIFNGKCAPDGGDKLVTESIELVKKLYN